MTMCVRAMAAGLIGLCSLAAGYAEAYEVNASPTTPISGVQIGEVVSFDLFLDTQGESNIWGFSVGMHFDRFAFDYREDASHYEEFVLYAPGASKTEPASWLEGGPSPTGAPWLWTGNSGPNHVNFDMVWNELLSGAGPGTTATATNAFLGTISFEATAAGTHAFDLSFQNDGNVFSIFVNGTDFTEITDLVGTPATFYVTVVPEPSTVLLVGLGLVALGLRAGRRG